MHVNLSEAIDISKHTIHAFFIERDADKTLSFLNQKNASWIGPGEGEIRTTPAGIYEYFKSREKSVQPYRIVDETYEVGGISADSCVIIATVAFESGRIHDVSYRTGLRLTFYLQLVEGKLAISNLHVSTPVEKTAETKFFFQIPGEDAEPHLQLDIKRINEIVQLLINTIPAGIKCTVDEGDYPYFYVNQRLLDFLGYTRRDFMKKTGGTALGTVYPPDREKFLEDIRACFAHGSEYSTEYRIEKNDGSLARVLEWGRRIRKDTGKPVISSVLVHIPDAGEVPEAPASLNEPFAEPAIPIHLFMDTALDILNHTADECTAIFNVLELTAKTLNVDRICLGLFEDGLVGIRVLWQWHAADVEPLPNCMAKKKRDVLSRFNADGMDICEDAAVLRDPDLLYCAEAYSIRSYLRCLLRKNDESIGLVSVQHTKRARAWTQHEMILLQSAARLLVNPTVGACAGRQMDAGRESR